ncbi:hypothetical protein KIPB_007000 [Kipferlia bialata]|uniref:Uncharacterized protein n=1 Tax=Kipferlia bialata TaxID=797122 RepID=A0A9K3GK92_9EUKA|nr:hypothetical protein KIPB_007000 [Kipferlia bialata]|eukprot:g7000.t1
MSQGDDMGYGYSDEEMSGAEVDPQEKRRRETAKVKKEREEALKVTHGLDVFLAAIKYDLLKAELRTAEDQKSAAGKELHERKVQLHKHRARYDVIHSKVMAAAAQLGADVDPRAHQAHCLVQAATLKGELEEKGDKLDKAIRQAEGEV